MPKIITRLIQFFGVYRAIDTVISIWSGKSLFWLALLSATSVVISTIQNGFDWGAFDKYALSFASIYAVLAVGWLVSIIAYRKISPKNRLVITTFTFNCDSVPQSIPHQNPKQANRFQAVIVVGNIAEFPISYLVEEIDFRIDKTVADDKYQNRGSVVDAGQISQFTSGIVSFHLPINLPAKGELKAKIKYGRPGKEQFNKVILLGVSYVVDPTQPLGIRYEFYHLDEKTNSTS